MKLSATEMNEKCMNLWLDSFYENYLENASSACCPYVAFHTQGYTGSIPVSKIHEYVEEMIQAEIPKYISDALVKLKEEGYTINTVIKPIGNTTDPNYINIEVIIKS